MNPSQFRLPFAKVSCLVDAAYHPRHLDSLDPQGNLAYNTAINLPVVRKLDRRETFLSFNASTGCQ